MSIKFPLHIQLLRSIWYSNSLSGTLWGGNEYSSRRVADFPLIGWLCYTPIAKDVETKEFGRRSDGAESLRHFQPRAKSEKSGVWWRVRPTVTSNARRLFICLVTELFGARMNAAYQPDRQRLPRFLGSCFLIGLGYFAIGASSNQENGARILATILYSAYLVGCAILIATIVARLYQHHEIRRMTFDLVNLILVTTLIALPFALASTFWGLFGLDQVQELTKDKTKVLIILTGLLAFLMFPVFFVVEAIVSWASLIFGKAQTFRDKERGG